MANPFNGIRVKVVGSTICIPLPADQRTVIDGGCGCTWCRAHPDKPPMWDTIATSLDAPYTWTIHYPELGGG